MTGYEPTVQRDAGRGDLLTPELIEAAAKALYESQRQPEYADSEYDWPNIDRGYDRDDEDNTDPEWCRNSYRADARVVLAVVVPMIREQIAAEIEAIPVVYPHGSSRYALDVRSDAVRVARGEDR